MINYTIFAMQVVKKVEKIRTKRNKRYRQYIPFIFALALILGLTLQKTSDNVELSEKCRKAVVVIADGFGIDTGDVWWNTTAHFRRIGHVIEYFILGMTVCVAVKNPYISLLICEGVSITDQVIKIFVPVRHFDAVDLGFDAIGYVLGIAVVFLILRIHRE